MTVEAPGGTCLFCGCTDSKPCEPVCGWTDTTCTLCTQCATAITVVESFITVFGELAFVQPPRSVVPARLEWGTLPPHHQRVLVMACRALCDRWADAAVGALSEKAIENLHAADELGRVATFLSTRAPREVRPNESLSAMVTRLLDPHLVAEERRPAGW